ncbi:hypothetical protein Q5P01_018459 [Channa striata]|uniref:Uncharacterized protein n=1 Tax=Channa striata TaxID=64152 RepID=A0AA88SE38_CHASR|nr:hypothetical protein Q5P01_018459 [Channa striata]
MQWPKQKHLSVACPATGGSGELVSAWRSSVRGGHGRRSSRIKDTFAASIVTMEEEEVVEMSKEELQKWIRDQVHKSELISPDILKKCKLLQSTVEKREKQAEHLLKLCKSVAAFEAIVKTQYALLGWEYNDTDSDGNLPDYRHSLSSSCDPVHSDTQVCCSPATVGPTPLLEKLQDRENPSSNNGKNCTTRQLRKPVVVLTRLPESKISPPLSSAPQNQCSEHESSSSSDMQWEPEDNSSDSDFTESTKKRKIDGKSKKRGKSGAAPQASTSTNTKSSRTKTATPQARSVKSSKAKTVTTKVDRNTNAKSNARRTSTPPKSTDGIGPMCPVATLCQSSGETTQRLPRCVPHREVCVNMHVLARKRAMEWQQGQIVEILTKDDGRVKYKVNFEKKGKSLLSGHHIAFVCMPSLEQLIVGARVVVKCPADQPKFCPGILAELPSRKNKMRFLIFTDDHTPHYLGLQSLHLVCKPLMDPLDDILDKTHKSFMKEYLNAWPFPLHTMYRVGQIINVELNGVQEKCEVQLVDCSLIQVVFQKDQHKEWIYRGSIRLEHMIKMIMTLKAGK